MSKKIQCFDFADLRRYKNFKSNHPSNFKNNYSINLSNADIQVLQAVLPNYQNFIYALRKQKANIKPTLNLVNIFNENNDFKVDSFENFEPSFKVSFSFLIGMIMTIIFAYRKLHITSLYHYNDKRNTTVKQKIKLNTKIITEPDFVGYNKNNQSFLLEAKGTTDKKVDSSKVEKALEQLVKRISSKTLKNLNAKQKLKIKNKFQKNKAMVKQLINYQYAVATAFGDVYSPSEGKKAYLSIIDPEFEGRFNPYKGVHNLYANFNEKDYHKLTEKDIPNFSGREFNIEDRHVRISLYDRFFRVREENFYGTNQERQDIEGAFNAFQNEVENHYDKIKKKLGRPNLFFIDGMMIAY